MWSGKLLVAGLFAAIGAASGQGVTLSNQQSALYMLKASMDGNQALSSWGPQNDVCSQWKGVVCNSQGAVTDLKLSNLQLAGQLPFGDNVWSALPELKSIDLSNNFVGGYLPPGIGDDSKLESLNLGGNAFNGKLPPSWGKLSKLRTLNLQNNVLEGPLPSQWSNLSNLQTLDLSSQKQSGFTGGIPSEWRKTQGGQVTGMTSLNNLNVSVPGATCGGSGFAAPKNFQCGKPGQPPSPISSTPPPSRNPTPAPSRTPSTAVPSRSPGAAANAPPPKAARPAAAPTAAPTAQPTPVPSARPAVGAGIESSQTKAPAPARAQAPAAGATLRPPPVAKRPAPAPAAIVVPALEVAPAPAPELAQEPASSPVPGLALQPGLSPAEEPGIAPGTVLPMLVAPELAPAPEPTLVLTPEMAPGLAPQPGSELAPAPAAGKSSAPAPSSGPPPTTAPVAAAGGNGQNTALQTTLQLTGLNPDQFTKEKREAYEKLISQFSKTPVGSTTIDNVATGGTGRRLLSFRRHLLQASGPLSVTSTTRTGDRAAADRNIRESIANGSLPQALKRLGLNYVPGSLSTSTVVLPNKSGKNNSRRLAKIIAPSVLGGLLVLALLLVCCLLCLKKGKKRRERTTVSKVQPSKEYPVADTIVQAPRKPNIDPPAPMPLREPETTVLKSAPAPDPRVIERGDNYEVLKDHPIGTEHPNVHQGDYHVYPPKPPVVISGPTPVTEAPLVSLGPTSVPPVSSGVPMSTAVPISSAPIPVSSAPIPVAGAAAAAAGAAVAGKVMRSGSFESQTGSFESARSTDLSSRISSSAGGPAYASSFATVNPAQPFARESQGTTAPTFATARPVSEGMVTPVYPESFATAKPMPRYMEPTIASSRQAESFATAKPATGTLVRSAAGTRSPESFTTARQAAGSLAPGTAYADSFATAPAARFTPREASPVYTDSFTTAQPTAQSSGPVGSSDAPSFATAAPYGRPTSTDDAETFATAAPVTGGRASREIPSESAETFATARPASAEQTGNPEAGGVYADSFTTASPAGPAGEAISDDLPKEGLMAAGGSAAVVGAAASFVTAKQHDKDDAVGQASVSGPSDFSKPSNEYSSSSAYTRSSAASSGLNAAAGTSKGGAAPRATATRGIVGKSGKMKYFSTGSKKESTSSSSARPTPSEVPTISTGAGSGPSLYSRPPLSDPFPLTDTSREIAAPAVTQEPAPLPTGPTVITPRTGRIAERASMFGGLSPRIEAGGTPPTSGRPARNTPSPPIIPSTVPPVPPVSDMERFSSARSNITFYSAASQGLSEAPSLPAPQQQASTLGPGAAAALTASTPPDSARWSGFDTARSGQDTARSRAGSNIGGLPSARGGMPSGRGAMLGSPTSVDTGGFDTARSGMNTPRSAFSSGATPRQYSYRSTFDGDGSSQTPRERMGLTGDRAAHTMPGDTGASLSHGPVDITDSEAGSDE